MTLALVNGKVYLDGALHDADLLIEGKKIARIGNRLRGEESIDIRGLTVLPGMIDTHVHFRVPGGEHKEDWRTGSMAAAAGGTTTVLAMPNTTPPITSQEDIDAQERLATQSIVNYGVYIGATKENIDRIDATSAAAVKVYYGSSTGTLLLSDMSDVVRLLEKTRKLVVVHAEHAGLLQHFGVRFSHTQEHHLMRPNVAAAVATAELVAAAACYGARLHIAHMSTKEEVELLRAYKPQGITCEATPQHLLLTSAYCSSHGAYGKMNPPLRAQEDQDALWHAVREGIVDMIVTDHAPHTREEKEAPDSPSGMPGVQTRLALMLNEIHAGRLTLHDVVRLCATNPAAIFGIRGRGAIAQGNYADLAIVDLEREETITNAQQHSKCGWTPFDGIKVRGWPVMTAVNGSIVYRDGELAQAPQGMLVATEERS
jgi:dihydroorotase